MGTSLPWAFSSIWKFLRPCPGSEAAARGEFQPARHHWPWQLLPRPGLGPRTQTCPATTSFVTAANLQTMRDRATRFVQDGPRHVARCCNTAERINAPIHVFRSLHSRRVERFPLSWAMRDLYISSLPSGGILGNTGGVGGLALVVGVCCLIPRQTHKTKRLSDPIVLHP